MAEKARGEKEERRAGIVLKGKLEITVCVHTFVLFVAFLLIFRWKVVEKRKIVINFAAQFEKEGNPKNSFCKVTSG